MVCGMRKTQADEQPDDRQMDRFAGVKAEIGACAEGSGDCYEPCHRGRSATIVLARCIEVSVNDVWHRPLIDGKQNTYKKDA